MPNINQNWKITHCPALQALFTLIQILLLIHFGLLREVLSHGHIQFEVH